MEEREIDEMIQQVERLYHSVTGAEAPAPDDLPHVEIPPERDPVQHVEEQIERLTQMLEVDPRSAPASDVQATPWTPAASFWETHDMFVVQIDLPGVPRSTLHIDLREGYLDVHGVRPPPHDSTTQLTKRWSENATGAFRRTIMLPQLVRSDEIKAELRDGVLDLRIPRAARQAKPIPLS